MSKQERMKKLSDDELEMVSGGSTRAYLAAVDLMNGKYGTGEACRQKLADEGLDYWMIQHMANALSHPVFEFAAIYNANCGYGETDRAGTEDFLGIPIETSSALWHGLLEQYFESTEEHLLQSVEDKAKVIGYARLMRHYIRRNGMENEADRRKIAYYRGALEELLPRVDTLLF